MKIQRKVRITKQANLMDKDSLLPPQDPSMEGKLTVCMEMDEVFLHVFYPDEYEGYLNQPLRDHDYYIDFEEYNTFLNVYKRNKCDELFSFLENETEAVIFSTGTKEYVDKVMDFVDPDYKVFKHRLYQDSCNFVNQEEEELQEFVKDLDWLGRDIKRTVLIDPKPFSFWCNPDNSIPVKPYNGHSLSDKEIDIIISILDDLRSSSDVSFELAQSFGIRDTLREANLL